MNDITEPLTLAAGSHQAGSGKGCAMNVISWENGDTIITDFPKCSDPFLARIVQRANDNLADDDGLLSAANSLIVLGLGHATVGTTGHTLTQHELGIVYARCAIFAARKAVHLDTTGRALPVIVAAERWADDPTEANALAAGDAATNSINDDREFAKAAAGYAADAAYTASFGYLRGRALYAKRTAGFYEALHAVDFAGRYESISEIELVGEIIDLFKSLTSTTSPEPQPETVACAVQNMLVKV